MSVVLVRGRPHATVGIGCLNGIRVSDHRGVIVMTRGAGRSCRMVGASVLDHRAWRRRRDGYGNREDGKQQCAHECHEEDGPIR